MKTLVERIDDVIADCLYRPEEVPERIPPVDAVIIKGVVREFAFHPTRLASHKADIALLCDELPSEFHKSGGGGWTFLNLCMDKHGNQWGEQISGEALVVLAIATDQGGFLLSRDMWCILPGGVPYVWLGL